MTEIFIFRNISVKVHGNFAEISSFQFSWNRNIEEIFE